MSQPRWESDYKTVYTTTAGPSESVVTSFRIAPAPGMPVIVYQVDNSAETETGMLLYDDDICGLLMARLHRKSLSYDEILRAFDLLDDDLGDE